MGIVGYLDCDRWQAAIKRSTAQTVCREIYAHKHTLNAVYCLTATDNMQL